MKPTSVMIYGQSSSTKTTQLYFLAKWLWQKFNLKTRLISSDPGGYAPFIDSGFIDQGIVQVFDFTNRDLVLADLRRLSKGYWPRYTKDDNGNLTEFFRTEDVYLTTPEEWNQIGMVAIDTMYQTAEILKSHCVQRPGNTVGFKESWEYVEDGETIRGSQMGHYGLVQDEMLRLHRTGFCNLPVKYLVWTSLVGAGAERSLGENKSQSREKIYGPQLIGNATTPFIPSWFMHCLHLDSAILPKTVVENGIIKIVEGGETEEKKVAWYVDHLDNDGIRYICKARVLPEKIPELQKYFPFGCVPLGYKNGIEKYFMVLDKLKEKGEVK